MRKWMRDRLQRRKKTPASPSDQPAPPPLQPAYFDAEQVPDAGNAETQEPEPVPLPAIEDQPVRSPRASSEERPSEGQPEISQPTAGRSAPGGRSRRRRGGRGRGGRGREQAVAQAFAPAAVKGSIPAPPAGATEEQMPEAEAEGEAAEPVAAPAPQPP